MKHRLPASRRPCPKALEDSIRAARGSWPLLHKGIQEKSRFPVAPLLGMTHFRGFGSSSSASHVHLFAQLLRNHAGHHGVEIFTGFLQHKRVSRVVPRELETGREGGNPYFAHGCVWRDYELHFFRFFKKHFELSGFPLDVKAVLIAENEETLLEVLESGVGLALEVFFL